MNNLAPEQASHLISINEKQNSTDKLYKVKHNRGYYHLFYNVTSCNVGDKLNYRPIMIGSYLITYYSPVSKDLAVCCLVLN